MGMFDIVYVECPECSRMIEFQSKAGNCNLDRFTKRDVPPVIAIDLDGESELCKCGHLVQFFTTTCCIVDIK